MILTLLQIIGYIPADSLGMGPTEPASSFDITNYIMNKVLHPELWAVAIFVVIAMQFIKELAVKKERWPDPRDNGKTEITVKLIKLSELTIKILVVGISIVAMILYRLQAGVELISKASAFNTAMTIGYVNLIYFFGGKYLAQGLVNIVLSSLKKLNVIKKDNEMTEEEYYCLKKDVIQGNIKPKENDS